MKAKTAASMIVALATGALGGAQTYSITDLGVAPGEQISTGESLNSKGQAVGTSSNVNGAFGVATLFAGGAASSLGSFAPNDDTFATSISDAGLITGYIYDTVAQVSSAMLYSGGRMTSIADTALFPAGSDGTGINDAGQVCGYGWPTTVSTHAFLYSNGVTTDLGTLGGAESVAEAIGASGQVVGQSANAAGVTHGFLYQNGKMTDLGVPAGDSMSSAIAISSNGLILGILQTSGGAHVGIYSAGAWKDIGGGATPTSINSSGVVVGWFNIPGVYSPRSKRRPSMDVGAVFRNGSFVNLNTLVPPNSGYAITMAESINDAGQILCDAQAPGDVTHAVLLTPQ